MEASQIDIYLKSLLCYSIESAMVGATVIPMHMVVVKCCWKTTIVAGDHFRNGTVRLITGIMTLRRIARS